MGSFASISVDPASVSFGNLTANSFANPIINPGSGVLVATSISNKVHALTIKSSSTWTDGSTILNLDEDGSPGVDAISLRADDDPTVSDAQFVTATTVDITNHSTDDRDVTEAGTDTDVGLFLDVGAVGTGAGFEGTVTVAVVN